MLENKDARNAKADAESLMDSERKRKEEIAAFQKAAEEKDALEEARMSAHSVRHPQRNTGEALPLIIPQAVGLTYVPEHLHSNYRRAMNGDYVLEYISVEDKASWEAYQPEIRAGKLRSVAAGDSPELQRLRAEHGKARAADVLAMLDKQKKRAEAANEEAFRKRQQAEADALAQARWYSTTVNHR